VCDLFLFNFLFFFTPYRTSDLNPAAAEGAEEGIGAEVVVESAVEEAMQTDAKLEAEPTLSSLEVI